MIAHQRVVYIWDQQERTLVRRVTDHPAEIIGLVGGTGKRFATLYLDGTVRVWNVANGQLLHQCGDPSLRAAYAGTFLNGGEQLLVGFQRGRVECYDMSNGDNAWSLESSITPYRIEISNSGSLLYVGSPTGHVECWDIETKRLVNKQQAHQRAVLQLEAHPVKGQIATAGSDGEIKIWDEKMTRTITTMRSGNSWLNCIAFVPDGTRILSGNEHTLTCWDSDSGRELISLSLERCVHQMAFNQDGTEIALASDRRLTDPKDAPLPRVRIFKAPVLR